MARGYVLYIHTKYQPRTCEHSVARYTSSSNGTTHIERNATRGVEGTVRHRQLPVFSACACGPIPAKPTAMKAPRPLCRETKVPLKALKTEISLGPVTMVFSPFQQHISGIGCGTDKETR
jgi:hypothetical protein